MVIIIVSVVSKTGHHATEVSAVDSATMEVTDLVAVCTTNSEEVHVGMLVVTSTVRNLLRMAATNSVIRIAFQMDLAHHPVPVRVDSQLRPMHHHHSRRVEAEIAIIRGDIQVIMLPVETVVQPATVTDRTNLTHLLHLPKMPLGARLSADIPEVHLLLPPATSSEVTYHNLLHSRLHSPHLQSR